MMPHQDLLRDVMAGGLPSVAKGYLDQVAIPRVMNQSTLMGLGRSGGAEHAVAQEALAPGVDIMKLLLGLPPVATKTKTKQDKGVFDWLGDILGLAGTGMDVYSKWPGGGTSSGGGSSGGGTDWLADIFGRSDPFGGAEQT